MATIVDHDEVFLSGLSFEVVEAFGCVFGKELNHFVACGIFVNQLRDRCEIVASRKSFNDLQIS